MSMPFFRSKRFATNTETIQTLVDGAPSVPTVSFGSWVWPKPDSGAVKAKDQRTATAARQKRLVTLVGSIVKKPVTDAGKIYREPSQSVKDGSAERCRCLLHRGYCMRSPRSHCRKRSRRPRGHGRSDTGWHHFRTRLRAQGCSPWPNRSEYPRQGNHDHPRRLYSPRAIGRRMHGDHDGQAHPPSSGDRRRQTRRHYLHRRPGESHHHRPKVYHRAVGEIYYQLNTMVAEAGLTPLSCKLGGQTVRPYFTP